MLPLGLLHHNVPPSRMVRRWSLKHGFTVAVSGLMPHVRGELIHYVISLGACLDEGTFRHLGQSVDSVQTY